MSSFHEKGKAGKTAAPAVASIDERRGPGEPIRGRGASVERMASHESDSEDKRGEDRVDQDEPNEDEVMASKAVMDAQDEHSHARALRAAIHLHTSRP